MTVGTAWPYNSRTYDQALLPPSALPQRIFGGMALVCLASICAWTICTALGNGAEDGAAGRADRLAFAASRGDRLAAVRLPESAVANIDAAPFDSRFAAAFPPGVFLGSASFAADERSALSTPQATPQLRGRQFAERTPSPAPRSFAPRLRLHGKPSPRDDEERTETVADAPAPVDKPTIFERVFGSTPSAIYAKLFGPSPSSVKLAYAAPGDGIAADGANVASGLYDRQTAVYDISAHTVYMPDGTTLEAHSGLGSSLDNPRYAAIRGRGPTPPDIYDLRPRERLFHGVRALRLIPVDERKVFGRSGLLAHTYMLGPNGQSNGCVSFKDYDAFLQAYENHEITRLAVVSSVD